MPEYREVHEDKIMTGLTVGYESQDYIADLVMPVVPVNERSGKYFVFGGEQFRVQSSSRAPGTRPVRIQFAMSKDEYYATQYMREHGIDDIERQETDKPLERERDALITMTEQHLLEKEVRVKDFLYTGGDITQTAAFAGAGILGQEWNDHTNAVPVDDTKAVKQAMRAAGGREPNTLIMSAEVFEELQLCAQIIDALPNTTEKFRANEEQVARAMQVRRIIVGRAQYDTATEGDTMTLGPVWGDTVLWAYITPNPGMRRRSLGYQFQWIPRRGYSHRDDDVHSDIVGIEECVGEEIVAADCGYLGTNAIQ